MTYEKVIKEFHKGLDKEILRRAERMKNVLSGSLEQIETKKLLDKELCKKDFRHWINNFVWLYEPRPTPKAIPFMPFPYQWECLEKIRQHIETGKDLRIDKSRDMGVTWMVLVVFTYLWQFHKMTFLVGSRKSEEVDKIGDMDTLLPKVKFLLEKQPKWLLPQDFSFDKHCNWMNIVNPETQGSIAGESNNANFGTGGRRNAIFFDEFSKWEYTDSAAWTSSGANTNCRIPVSTPLFKNNRFYALLKEPIENLSLHWSLHPFKSAGLRELEDGKKTSDWYEVQKTRYRPDELAQELDISYSGTQQSTVFHDELARMRMEKRINVVPYNPGISKLVWSFDPGDTLWSNGFYQILGYAEEIRWFDYYEDSNKDILFYIDWVKSPDRPWNKIRQEDNGRGINYRQGWRSMIVIPDPHDLSVKSEKSGKSIVTQLKDAGFTNIILKPVGRLEALSEARRIFKNLWMDNGKSCPRMIIALDRMQGYHKRWNERMQEHEEEPVHDINSHCADQFKGLANWIKNPEKMAIEIEKQKNRRDRIKEPIVHNVGMAGY